MGRPLRIKVAPAPLRRVLVVEDEPEMLQRLGRWFGAAGWMTVCVSSPEGAMRAVRRGSFDVAIIDYRLNEADDGIRLGRTLLRRYGLPFILISGYLTTPRVVEAVRAGALDVVEKPLAEDRFLTAVE